MLLVQSILSLVLVLASSVVSPVSASDSLISQPFSTSFHHLTHAACVTLFTREGKEGCGSASRDVQTGTLQLYSGEGSLQKLQMPYVAVIPEELLNKENVEDILSTNKKGFLQGILVTNNTFTSSDNSYYNPSSRSPNGKRTPSQFLNYGNSAYGWNSNGDVTSALLEVDFKGIPMAYVIDRDVSTTLLQEVNTDIVAEFNYYMGPLSDINSFKCLSWTDVADGVWRPKCLPLGGNSVWSNVLESNADENNRKLEQEVKKNDNRKLEDAATSGVFMLTASMDANSLFHDAMPAANEAATNILTILMASKLIGEAQFTSFNKIVVALFQGEAFGFLGSRRFLKDVLSFQCNSDPVPSVSKNNTSEEACLNPLRPSLEFTKILEEGAINGMLSVDQVGVLTNSQNLYVHTDGTDYGSFLSAILQGVAPNSYTISEVEADADDDHFDGDDVTVPPTPLTSLLSLTAGATGGAVLTGYADTFNPTAHYGSHRNSIWYQTMNMEAIATAATTLARAAVAAASDDGSLDSDTALAYALTVIPDALSADDDELLALADCLYKNGNCALLQKYANVEAATESKKTGLPIVAGNPLGSPPNYYTSVYTGGNGQPFVSVDKKVYGSYSGDLYGKDTNDVFGVQPSLLEHAIRGLLNDYLGRPASTGSLQSCKKTSDCNKVDYCPTTGTQEAICTGGHSCVCRQAHFHLALDEALEAAPDNSTGRFLISADDEQISALYTEPYWDGSVGVKVYRDADNKGAVMAIIVGSIVVAASIAATFTMKRILVKEKLY